MNKPGEWKNPFSENIGVQPNDNWECVFNIIKMEYLIISGDSKNRLKTLIVFRLNNKMILKKDLH